LNVFNGLNQAYPLLLKRERMPSVRSGGRLYVGRIWRCNRKKAKPNLITGKHNARQRPVIAHAKQVNYTDPRLLLHFWLLFDPVENFFGWSLGGGGAEQSPRVRRASRGPIGGIQKQAQNRLRNLRNIINLRIIARSINGNQAAAGQGAMIRWHMDCEISADAPGISSEAVSVTYDR
jgi:hypothetical protein